MTNATETQGRQTLIEEGTTFRGSLDSKCEIVVNGTVEGDLTGPSLLVNVGGVVQGNVTANVIRSNGQLQGTFEAEEFRLSGRVCDDTIIRADTLAVKLAKADEPPIVLGECVIEIGEAPSAEEVLKRRAAQAKPTQAKPTQAKPANAGAKGGDVKSGAKTPQAEGTAPGVANAKKKNKGDKEDQAKKSKKHNKNTDKGKLS